MAFAINLYFFLACSFSLFVQLCGRGGIEEPFQYFVGQVVCLFLFLSWLSFYFFMFIFLNLYKKVQLSVSVFVLCQIQILKYNYIYEL